MNPSLLGAVSATLLVVLWLLTRRRPRPFLRSGDTSAVAALNRAQIALVKIAEVLAPVAPGTGAGAAAAGLPLGEVALPGPADGRGRRLLLQRLQAAAAADPLQRLEAMRIARLWGDRSVLPLLRRGLRDVHPAVVAEAARAIAAHRGHPGERRAAGAAAQPASMPRRVSRTR